MRVDTKDNRLHMYVTEDVNEMIPFPWCMSWSISGAIVTKRVICCHSITNTVRLVKVKGKVDCRDSAEKR